MTEELGQTIGKYIIPEIGTIYAKKTTTPDERLATGDFYAINLDNNNVIIVMNCESEKELKKAITKYISSKAQSLNEVSKKVSENGLEQYLLENIQNKSKTEI